MPPRFTSLLIGFGLVATLVSTTTANGQAPPDPSLWWPSDVVNPSGQRPVPVIAYDRSSGVLRVNTRGANGISDTTGGVGIGGDDVGLISLVIEGPPATAVLLDGVVDDVTWSGQHFNGKQQLFGTSSTRAFLVPGSTAVFQYPAGLDPADFGPVEMGINFALSAAGATLFGAVQFDVGPCPADTDDSGAVDVDDLLNVILDWGTDGSAHQGDIDGSGLVNADDLVALLLAWGSCA
ncbi:MAG: hypothetical protein ACYTGC_16030 [Planctomycetota bacterium]|jgi:hypothetical protein